MKKPLLPVLLRGALVLFLITGMLLGARALSKGREAHAASDVFFPTICLGGWENPKAASGEPSVSADADPAAFSGVNAAYLASDVSAQIFCGYFPVEAGERAPLSARIAFNWSLSAPLAPAPFEAPQDSASAPQNQEAAPASAESETPSAEQESEPATQSSTPPAPAEPLAPSAEDEKPPVPAEAAPVQEVAPAPESVQSFMDWLVPVAHAAEPDAPSLASSDFLEVSYSFDGVRWYSAGRVNTENWRSFSVSIPADSWENLQNVQIMVAALPSLGERPAVYLDSVALHIENNLSFTDVVMDGAEAVGDAVDEAFALADSVSDSLANLFDANADTQPAAAALSESAPAPLAKEKKLSFEKRFEIIASDFPSPDVSVKDNGLSLIVHGACTEPYFVVLTYRRAEDVSENPRSFVSNYAGACSDGSFSYDMKNLPVDTLPGNYYLIVGAQGAEDTWRQVSAPSPISISSVEAE